MYELLPSYLDNKSDRSAHLILQNGRCPAFLIYEIACHIGFYLTKDKVGFEDYYNLFLEREKSLNEGFISPFLTPKDDVDNYLLRSLLADFNFCRIGIRQIYFSRGDECMDEGIKEIFWTLVENFYWKYEVVKSDPGEQIWEFKKFSKSFSIWENALGETIDVHTKKSGFYVGTPKNQSRPTGIHIEWFDTRLFQVPYFSGDTYRYYVFNNHIARTNITSHEYWEIYELKKAKELIKDSDSAKLLEKGRWALKSVPELTTNSRGKILLYSDYDLVDTIQKFEKPKDTVQNYKGFEYTPITDDVVYLHRPPKGTNIEANFGEKSNYCDQLLDAWSEFPHIKFIRSTEEFIEFEIEDQLFHYKTEEDQDRIYAVLDDESWLLTIRPLIMYTDIAKCLDYCLNQELQVQFTDLQPGEVYFKVSNQGEDTFYKWVRETKSLFRKTGILWTGLYFSTQIEEKEVESKIWENYQSLSKSLKKESSSLENSYHQLLLKISEMEKEIKKLKSGKES